MRSERVWHVELLADHPDLIPAVGELRQREWGHWGEQDLAWFVDVTRSESGRTELPVTFVGLAPTAPSRAPSASARLTRRNCKTAGPG